jgi:hypothetical protein
MGGKGIPNDSEAGRGGHRGLREASPGLGTGVQRIPAGAIGGGGWTSGGTPLRNRATGHRGAEGTERIVREELKRLG